MTFGETLRALRDKAGLTGGELCKRAGTSLDSLRNWETGRAIPRLDAATRLADALGVPLDSLGIREEEIPANGSNGAQAKPARRKKPAAAKAGPLGRKKKGN
jgi:transcriptional regulator with XRE-family HTH domain